MDFQFQAVPYDGSVPAAPKHSGIYKVFDTRGRMIVLDKTSNLYERLERFYGPRPEAVRDLDLRTITSRVEYLRTDSPFETLYVLNLERKRYFPGTYRKMRTFRYFPLIKINRRQRFPRIYASRQIKAGVDYFGPLVTRGQFARLKTALERTFKLRPCLYNIRGDDPHPDCLYFQMRTCSRPCNNDIGRADYLDDVRQAIAFVQGFDDDLEQTLAARMTALAEQAKFEDAAALRRRIEKVRRARQESRESLYSVWNFDFAVLLPADSVTRCKIAFVRQGCVTGFETYEAAAISQVLPADVERFLRPPASLAAREAQYDEFCLVSNFIVAPVQSVSLIRVGPIENVTEQVMERLSQLKRKRTRTREPSAAGGGPDADVTDDAD